MNNRSEKPFLLLVKEDIEYILCVKNPSKDNKLFIIPGTCTIKRNNESFWTKEIFQRLFDLFITLSKEILCKLD